MSYPPDFPPPRTATNPNPYTLTREERRVLQECIQESFYQRCVPLMATLGLGAYYCVNMGYLKKNPMYGALPKVVIGMVTGFLVGKLSYKEKCEEKILRLPGGQLKESILMNRRRRDNVWSEYRGATSGYANPSYPGGQNVNRYEDPRLVSDSEVESHHDTFDSFNSRLDSSDDREQQLPSILPSRSVSYDELRYRNRDEYEKRRRQIRPGILDEYSSYGRPYSPDQAYPPPPPPRYIKPEDDDNYISPVYPDHDQAYSTPSQPRVPAQRKNFYGDIIER